MTAIIINEKTRIGKNVIEMLRAISAIEKDNSIKFLDETEFLLSNKKNKEVLEHGVKQVKEGHKGKIIKTTDLWK
jgi:predicted HAD superfamily phosphohydrolase